MGAGEAMSAGGHVEGVGGALADRRYQALLELAAMDKLDFEQRLHRILETDAEILDLERVNCWEFTTAPQGIRCISGYLRSRRAYERGAFVSASTCPRYFEALSNNPVILADDARSDPRTSELTSWYLDPLGITSMMDVPIWVRGTLWGVVCHEHVGPPRAWTAEERDFATSIGHIVSMTLESRERAEAERLVQLTETFMGVLSHDLRSPLGAIQSSAQHLAKSADAGTCKLAGRILSSTSRMTRMVDQLLDFTRIRVGGGIPVCRQPVDLADLGRQVVAEERQRHPARDIVVHERGDATGSWDPDRMWQVVANLVVNALEHGERDEPVEVAVDGSDPDRVVVSVRSRGTVPPDVRQSIFEPFRQGNGDSGRPAGGLGLGLYISREIVAAHEGSIALDARPGDTTFEVTLPRHPTSAPRC